MTSKRRYVIATNVGFIIIILDDKKFLLILVNNLKSHET